jgi:hypothetical protein
LWFWVCKFKGDRNEKVRIVNLGIVKKPDDYYWGFIEILKDVPLVMDKGDPTGI